MTSIPVTPLLLLAVLGAVLVVGLYVVRGWRRENAGRATVPLKLPQHLHVLKLSCDWIWQADANLRINSLDERFSAATGLAPQTVQGHAPWALDWQLLSELDWTRVREAVAQHAPVDFQVAYLDHNGQQRYMHWRGAPLAAVDAASPTYLGIGRDITETIRSAELLTDNQHRLETLLGAVSEAVFRTDEHLRLRLLNPAWQTLTGYAPDHALGETLGTFFHPDERSAVEDLLNAVLKGELTEAQGQYRLRKRSGDMSWVSLRARVVCDSTQAQPNASRPPHCTVSPGLVGTLTDISSLKIAELNLRNINLELEARVRARTVELEASNRELEAFSYSVSHDLRSPLRTIDGFARILEDDLGDRLDDESRNHLERIRAAAARMSLLTDQLLELARFSRRPLIRQTVDLSEIAQQIMEDLCAQNPQRRVEFSLTSGLLAIADPVLMHVVLENLLLNAWKFTAHCDPARIAFAAEVRDDERVFCLSDNGEGFDMACADKLFRPFYRVHAHTQFSGTGIGLANVERAIHRHGGRVWAEAKVGEGARIYFTLNALRSATDTPATSISSCHNGAAPRSDAGY